jgi:hypothetical protein
MDTSRSFSISTRKQELPSSFGLARRMKTERIYGRLLHIFEMAKKEGILPLEAANRYAQSRIREIHKMKRLHVPKEGMVK